MSKLKSNLHTHTIYSDGCGTIDENIKIAIDRGFLSIGISDHSYTGMDDGCMNYGVEREYINEARRKAIEYDGVIDVFCGIELDSFSECERGEYDYVIGSVHNLKIGGENLPVDLSIDDQKRIVNEFFNGNQIDFVKEYYENVVINIEKNSPDIVGHFDLITKFGFIDENSAEYKNTALDALSEIMKYCKRFEVNTGAMARGYRKEPYPNDFILKEILQKGGSVIVTSDSHDPLKLDFAFCETAEELRKIGFTHTDRLTKSGFVSDKL